ncbi:MAG: NERD domain-containing protein [Cellulomonadaceae bacterium]
MPAGHSADLEARRLRAQAAAHQDAAKAAESKASNYAIAAVTEKRTAKALAPLAAAGYHLLADRAWPGSRRAQVDMIVVGPGGVFIVDTTAWAEVGIDGERIFRGQEDATDDVMNLADLAYKTEGELVEIGLAPGEVHPVVVLAGRKGVSGQVGPVAVVGEGDVVRHIARNGTRLTSSQVDAVVARIIAYCPPVGAPAPVNTALPEPVLPEPPAEIEQGELLTASEVEAALLEGLMAAPVEEWMTFLHPTQAKLVRRSFNGPSRIRGAAGTGKTVVGLHRAAYLARTRPGTVLVTTYVKTLPNVLGRLLERLAPDAVGQIEFCGVHAFARRVLDERGIDVRIRGKAIDDAWSRAWHHAGREKLRDLGGSTERYWREEINQVIKARGITRFDDYANLARTGRRHRLTIDQRRADAALPASRLVAGDQYVDIDSGDHPVLSRGDVAGTVTRSGRVVDQVRKVTREVGTTRGDIGVLCVGTKAAEQVRAHLRDAGIPSIDLYEYDGGCVDAVKVGTVTRAKGLEFKQVLLADVRRDWLAEQSSDEDSAESEKTVLLRRELYVAMTRARDGLWVGVV